jgi:hypothetical protein
VTSCESCGWVYQEDPSGRPCPGCGALPTLEELLSWRFEHPDEELDDEDEPADDEELDDEEPGQGLATVPYTPRQL